MGVAKKSLLAVLGFAQLGSSGDGMLLGLLRINHNDNWLHALVGVVLIVSGLAKKASAHPVWSGNWICWNLGGFVTDQVMLAIMGKQDAESPGSLPVRADRRRRLDEPTPTADD